MRLCYEPCSPFKHTGPQGSQKKPVFSVNTKSHVWLAQTPSNTQRDGRTREGGGKKKPSEAPCLSPRGATAEGSRTHLPSSASMASIVAEEEKEGGCKKNNERGEQRSSHNFCPRTTSPRAAQTDRQPESPTTVTTKHSDNTLTPSTTTACEDGCQGRGGGERRSSRSAREEEEKNCDKKTKQNNKNNK